MGPTRLATKISEAERTPPLAGITAGTSVLTLDGELPVQYLAPGDRVITRAGCRVLKDIEVSVMQNATMIRISATALGRARPEADLFVAPSQPILVRDARAKTLLERDRALIEAEHLTDGDYIRSETVAEVRLFTLRFEQEEVIFAGGLELACMPVAGNA